MNTSVPCLKQNKHIQSTRNSLYVFEKIEKELTFGFCITVRAISTLVEVYVPGVNTVMVLENCGTLILL